MMSKKELKMMLIKDYELTGKKLEINKKRDGSIWIKSDFLNYIIGQMYNEKYMNLQFVKQIDDELDEEFSK